MPPTLNPGQKRMAELPQQMGELGQSEKKATSPAFAVGDRVQVELSGAYQFDVPQPIERIDQDEKGRFWYFFEGSNAGIAEADLRHTLNDKSEAEHHEVCPQRRALRKLLEVNAWGNLPNDVALNQSVSAANLVLLAFRTTLKDFHLGASGLNVLVRGGGLGRDVFERSNTEAISLGLLDRRQPGGRPGSKFNYAVERLVLPESDFLRRRKVQRSWWRGELSLKELAALLYMRSAGKVPCWKLAERFEWNRQKAMAALRGLETRGLITSSPTRTPQGAFGPTFYRVIPRVPRDLTTVAAPSRAPENEPAKKSPTRKPGFGNPGFGRPGHVRTASQVNLSAQYLATLDTPNPPQAIAPSKSQLLMGGAAGPLKGQPAEDGKSELIKELRTADIAGALNAYLLSPKGVEGYQALVQEHGAAARSAVLAKLSACAIDGAARGKIWTWDYFRGAIDDEVKHTWMNDRGVRPGDVGSMQRKLKLEIKDETNGQKPCPACPEAPELQGPAAQPAHDLVDNQLRPRQEKMRACRARVDERASAWVERLEIEGAGRIDVRREDLLGLMARKQLGLALAQLAIAPEQVDTVMNRFVDLAIAQGVTPLAGWRKGLLQLAATSTPKKQATN